ncbi:hypothetical protein Tsubulata_032132 [Turnera subulata]|uniref:WRKY domain-containing protein n=1 Tax=Turnera subulata TaxID=218843 RepID=A0A9Q0F2H5_9ROSI|nr:hypothetical protein Tsubulata_032132 [Turnera subulata]
MAEDWDLYAIVRSCCTSATTTSAATSNTNTETNHPATNPLDFLATLTFDDEDNHPFSFPDPEQSRNTTATAGLQELQDSYRPFLPSATTSTGQGNILPSFSVSDFRVLSSQNQPQLVQQQRQQQQQPFTNVPISPRLMNKSQQRTDQPQQNQRPQLHQLGTNGTASVISLHPMQSPSPRSRKKKSNQKRLIMHITAENLSNDVWAWRKYGQKPIKGSPYPRNYYRCSSSKGCSARKQVEKSNTDPNMYIVSYTGDHTHPRPTHRNSLAGSTRTKFPAVEKTPDKEPEASTLSVNEKGTSLSPRTPLSATSMDHQEAPADHDHRKIKTENMEEGHAIAESDCDDCDEDDDDDDDDNDGNILIPNMALSEDIIKELQELC